MTAKGNLPAAAGSVVVPYGHVVGNEKWRGSGLARRLQGESKQQAACSSLLPNSLERASFRLWPRLSKTKSCSWL